MITQVQLTMKTENPCLTQPEWAYRLYAALLEKVEHEFGEELHQKTMTPVSQFVIGKKDELIWTVNLLGENSEKVLEPILTKTMSYYLQQEKQNLIVKDYKIDKIKDADQLFAMAMNSSGKHKIEFKTATAFKSQGQYMNLPTVRLIFNNLVKRWNDCFPEMLIEDEDREGIEALARGVRCKRFNLFDQNYRIKGNLINGFAGNIILENRLEGFHRQLADALMIFAGYSGVGIKTALGMGGVRQIEMK